MGTSFSKGTRGYNCSEVDNFFAELSAEHRAELESKEKELATLKQLGRHRKEELQKLKTQVDEHIQYEKEITDTLLEAQLQSFSILQKAQLEAGQLEQEAEAKVIAQKKKLNFINEQIRLAADEFEQVLEKHRNFLHKNMEYFTGGDTTESVTE